MKYKYLLLLIIPLFLGLFACSDHRKEKNSWATWTENNGKIKVLSTTGMIDNLVGEIGKERVDHIPLILGEIDPHSYELVKGDDEKISFAHIIFYNGLGLEHGASLQYQLEKHAHKVALGNEIQKRSPDDILRVDGQLDPHVWMDISLWVKAIDPIVEALSKEDAAHADFYRQNGAELRQTMLKVHAEITQRFKEVPANARYLVASHDAFNYFARAYLADENEKQTGEWRKRFAAPEGLAPDGQLSYTDIKNIIEHLSLYRIGVVFPESNVNRDSLKKIVNACSETGNPIKLSSRVLYGDAMGQSGSDADGYLNMLKHNCDVMVQEWSENAGR
jgi:manganese/zinc/iron transport system substrate-binding protein